MSRLDKGFPTGDLWTVIHTEKCFSQYHWLAYWYLYLCLKTEHNQFEVSKNNLSQLLYYNQNLGSAAAVASSRKLLAVLFARLLELFTLGLQVWSIKNSRFGEVFCYIFLFLATTRWTEEHYDTAWLTKWSIFKPPEAFRSSSVWTVQISFLIEDFESQLI